MSCGSFPAHLEPSSSSSSPYSSSQSLFLPSCFRNVCKSDSLTLLLRFPAGYTKICISSWLFFKHLVFCVDVSYLKYSLHAWKCSRCIFPTSQQQLLWPILRNDSLAMIIGFVIFPAWDTVHRQWHITISDSLREKHPYLEKLLLFRN